MVHNFLNWWLEDPQAGSLLQIFELIKMIFPIAPCKWL